MEDTRDTRSARTRSGQLGAQRHGQERKVKGRAEVQSRRQRERGGKTWEHDEQVKQELQRSDQRRAQIDEKREEQGSLWTV